ncbi:MAG: GspE/PulE family protein, partial [Terriglobia bacterium]
MAIQTTVARIGEILVRENRISSEQLSRGLEYQKTNGGKLGQAFVKLGYLTDDEVTSALSAQYGIPSIKLADIEIEPEILKLVPMDTALKHKVLPLARIGSAVTLAMADPANVFALDDVKFMTGLNVEPVLAAESAIEAAIKKFYGSADDLERKREIEDLVGFIDESSAGSVELEEEDDGSLSMAALERAAEEAPVIKLVNYILTDSVKRGASDIHMEPYEKEYRVRFRIDGLLQNMMAPPLKLRDAITSRIKIMAKLDIAEKRLPQDGRIMLRLMHQGKKKQLDLRVAVLPTLHGEKVVMRLLDKENLRLDMTKLGFEQESLDKFEKGIFK